MRRVAKYFAILCAFILILFAAGIFVASNMFDSRVASVISHINRRQNHVKLEYSPQTSSIFNKKGLLSVRVPNSKFGEISAVFDVDIDFSFSSVKANFHKINNEGTLDRIISSFNLPVIDLDGAVAFYPWELKGSGAVKSSSFSIPVEDGYCRFGENSLYVSSRGGKSLKVSLASAGIKCNSTISYNAQSAYTLEFLDLLVKAEPQIDIHSKSVDLDKINVSFKTFDAEASTLYMIGFKPGDKVRDESLRDKLKLTDFSVDLSLSDKDIYERRTLHSEGGMNLYFAMPYVKNKQVMTPYDLSNIKYDISFGALNFKGLMKALSDPDDIEKIIRNLSKPIDFEVGKFSFEHGNDKVSADGYAKILLDVNSGKLSDINARFNARSDRGFVDSLISPQQEQGLLDLIESGMIRLSRGVYSTTLEVKGKDITLNGKAFKAQEDDAPVQDEATSLDDN